jgi:hypothetical protein
VRTIIFTEGRRWSDVAFFGEVLQRLFACVRTQVPSATGSKCLGVLTPSGRVVELRGQASDDELLDAFASALPALSSDVDRVGLALDLDQGDEKQRDHAVRGRLKAHGPVEEAPIGVIATIQGRRVLVVTLGVGDGVPDIGVRDPSRNLEQVLTRVFLEGQPGHVPAIRDAVAALRRHGADPGWKSVAWMLAALEAAEHSPERLYHVAVARYPAACENVLRDLGLWDRLAALLA